ncbi:MAG: glycosyltransferase [Thermoleophilia bacterium]|nr:glycosyltransferase [Thermoleophilia bacterium]
MSEDRVVVSYPRVVAGILGALAVLTAALAGDWLESIVRGWMLAGGFGLIAGSLIGTSRRFAIPAILAIILVVFCGLSAVVAVPESAETSSARALTLSKKDLVSSIPGVGFDAVANDEGFQYASMVTGLAGLAAMAAALLAAVMLSAPPARRERRPAQIERIGKILVIFGFIGVAGALLRFLLTQFPVENLFQSFKSFWIGGTYLLLFATFAVPGFALWVQGMIARSAERREYVAPAIGAFLFVALLIPTGQRGFLIALAVMLLAVLIGNRVIGLRMTAFLVIVGVIFIGLTQAARNEISGTNKFTADGFIERVQPDQWRDLYSSQIASFNWTVLIEQNRDEFEIRNSFIDLLAKPIPRSIMPDKSQGFATEFTEQAFPGAAAQNVSFATPLVAEADYDFGPAGAIIILALLGGFVVFCDRRISQRAPPLVEPIVTATIFWVMFELIRGDIANALVFVAGWVLPLVIFSRALGLRGEPPIRKIIIDALQVAPRFSGIGRRVAEIGESLKRDPLPLPIEVRCAKDVVEEMLSVFPEGTTFKAPLRSSRPRVLRILYQQLIAPFFMSASTLLVCPGDQAPFWGRAQLLFVIHDVRRIVAPETAQVGLEAAYYKKVMTIGARRASHILTISEFSKSELTENLRPGCPVSIVSERPAGIEPVPFETIESSEPAFLLVGALRSYKGIETVIDAIGPQRSQGVAAKVNCVGDAEGDSGYAEEVKKLAADPGIDGRFVMTGWISDEELRDLYGRSIGTISASSYEGYGLSVSESLAAGLPTVASDIPPHREIGGDAALYFTPGDADALARLIDAVVSDPGRRNELARAARQRHEELRRADRPWSAAIREALDSITEPEPAGSEQPVEALPYGSPG